MQKIYIKKKETETFKTINATAILGRTLLGENKKGPYPLIFGNHFCMLANDGKEYFIRNFRVENLEHLLTKTIDFPIKIIPLNEKEAIISDERISKNYYYE